MILDRRKRLSNSSGDSSIVVVVVDVEATEVGVLLLELPVVETGDGTALLEKRELMLREKLIMLPPPLPLLLKSDMLNEDPMPLLLLLLLLVLLLLLLILDKFKFN